MYVIIYCSNTNYIYIYNDIRYMYTYMYLTIQNVEMQACTVVYLQYGAACVDHTGAMPTLVRVSWVIPLAFCKTRV